MIQFFGVSKRFPTGQSALDGINLEIARGEFCFITGASGAGKTTLLKLIFREDVPSSGQILVNGRNVSLIPRGKIPFLRRTIGVVFQDFRLIERKTIFENVAFLPRILGLDHGRQKRVAFEALRRVGLSHRMASFPSQLSGGEKQRVAIARALINEPEILIADEPTGNLDDDLSQEIVRLFLDIHLRGTTVLFATHDRALIESVGHRVLTLAHGKVVDDRPSRRSSAPRAEVPPGATAEVPGEGAASGDGS